MKESGTSWASYTAALLNYGIVCIHLNGVNFTLLSVLLWAVGSIISTVKAGEGILLIDASAC